MVFRYHKNKSQEVIKNHNPNISAKKKRPTPGTDDCPTGDVQLYQLRHLGMKNEQKGGGLTYNWILDLKLGGGLKYVFYFHPEPWGDDPILLIFFKWVETIG